MLHAVNQTVAQSVCAVRAGGGGAERSAARRRVRSEPVGRGDPGPSTPPAGLPLAPRRYFHVHGYDGHIGRHCRVILRLSLLLSITLLMPESRPTYECSG